MTKTNRFKTYAQLEKICKRILSRSAPRPEEIRNLEDECRGILAALAGDSFLTKISVGSPPIPSLIPSERVKIRA